VIPISGKRFLAGANAVILLYMLAPILVIIPVSFGTQQYVVFPPTGFTLRWYEHFFTSPELVDSLFLSIRLAVLATVLATILGTMAAVALVRYRVPGREALRAFFMSPIVVPGLVLGIAMLMFFSKTFLRSSFWALLLAHITVIMPYVIRTVSASLVGVDRTLEQAAESLGAPPFVAFRTVTLPLLKPGLIAASILAFVQSFDELVMSLFLTGPRVSTLPVQIFHYLEYNSDPTIAAISVVLILFSTTLVLLTERFVGFSQFL
jgi:putative spermidine/putrescine transport system permease protein